MGPAVVFLGALVGLLAAQGTGNDCPHKKSATLLPSFTVTPTPTATESTASPATTSHGTTTAGATSHEPTTATHRPTTATHRPTTATHRPPTTPRHGNTTIHPTTSNSTATSPAPTSSPPPGPPPPPPSPSPGPQEATGDYTWTNGSRPCVRLQARIQIGIVYPTQGGGKAWGISVLNPNKTKPQGGCEGTHPHLLLSFPSGQLSFGFKQEPRQGAVYLNYLALEYNVSFPQAAQWTFSGQNSSLRALQAPLGQSFGCRNASVLLAPALRLDLLHLKLQAAQLPPSGAFGPSFSCPSDQFNLLPLIIGLVSLGLLTLLLVTFCIVRRRPPAYQPL
ncbi:macrosialin isoform X1 [Mirounga angustirostris]|uniref:macrosialin isoform X1 n=1 Tax=Mirounga angustirostris TaxID=9716 RepID=UPI001E68D82D|nr:macrosialin [Mirounga angustirostris]